MEFIVGFWIEWDSRTNYMSTCRGQRARSRAAIGGGGGGMVELW